MKSVAAVLVIAKERSLRFLTGCVEWQETHAGPDGDESVTRRSPVVSELDVASALASAGYRIGPNEHVSVFRRAHGGRLEAMPFEILSAAIFSAISPAAVKR